jgi:hypothetical protein
MPWNQNRWIDVCNPIKLKEYLALGKPIVTTPFPELDGYRRFVYTAGCADEFARQIRTALTADCPRAKQDRRAAVAHTSWAASAAEIIQRIEVGTS